MSKRYQIELDENEWGQVLDGLVVRAESWRRTAEFMKTWEMPAGELFVIEECGDSEEADEIAVRYEVMIQNIQRQMQEQSGF
jgi:hypothetical protein